MTARALGAVLRARLYAQRQVVFYSCAVAFVAGLVQPAGVAAPLFLCSLIGIGWRSRRARDATRISTDASKARRSLAESWRGRRRSFRASPPSSRPSSTRGAQLAARRSRCGADAARRARRRRRRTLIALSATIRSGTARVLYVVLAARRKRRPPTRSRSWHDRSAARSRFARSSRFSRCANTAKRSRATIRFEPRLRLAGAASRASRASRD